MTRRLPRLERREQLIDVASSRFGERGYFHTNMDDIAGAAGITKPVLYQHFSSKEDLYLAVIDRVGSDLEHHISELAHRETTTEGRVRAGITLIFDPTTEKTPLLSLLFNTEHVSELVDHQVESVVDRAAQSIGRLVSHAHQLSEADALLIGHVFAPAILAARKRAQDWTDEQRSHMMETLCDLLTNGLTGVRDRAVSS